MADLPGEPNRNMPKVRVEGPTIPEFVVTITASSEGLYALTSYGKMWRFEKLGYVDHEWHAMSLPPLKGSH